MGDDAGQTGENGDAGHNTGENGDAGHKGEDDKVTLTKAELDARMAEVRRGVEASTAKKFADYDELKAKAERLDEAEEAQKTELQKAQDRAATLEKEKEAAERKATEALTRSAVIAAATNKVVDPEAAYRLINLGDIEFGDDGNPSNLSELLDALVEAKPYLAAGSSDGKPSGAKKANQGSRGTETLTRDDLKSMTPEEIVKAREDGRLDHLFTPS